MIVDGCLPGIDGATVVRRMRLDAVLRRTPCLLLTASEERADELRALDTGADAWRLSAATPEQRDRYEIIGAGTGIHGPDVDEDLGARGMLEGVPARRPSSR